MIEKLKQLYLYLVSKGLPIIIIQDPLTGMPSLTFTMALVSFITDQLRQTNASSESMMICAGLYLGRTISKKVFMDTPKDK